MRYLIEFRDGGPQRARELQPMNSVAVPERPLPRQPVVQRGEVEVEGNANIRMPLPWGSPEGLSSSMQTG